MIIKEVATPNHFIFFLIEIVSLQQAEYFHDYSKIVQDMQGYE